MRYRGTAKIHPGSLDRRITIQHHSAVQNSFNEPEETWVDVATVWAEVVPRKVSEMFLASEERMLKQALFRIRYRTGITRDMRIVWEGRIYRIVGTPNEVGRRIGLEIIGEEID